MDDAYAESGGYGDRSRSILSGLSLSGLTILISFGGGEGRNDVRSEDLNWGGAKFPGDRPSDPIRRSWLLPMGDFLGDPSWSGVGDGDGDGRIGDLSIEFKVEMEGFGTGFRVIFIPVRGNTNGSIFPGSGKFMTDTFEVEDLLESNTGVFTGLFLSVSTGLFFNMSTTLFFDASTPSALGRSTVSLNGRSVISIFDNVAGLLSSALVAVAAIIWID